MTGKVRKPQVLTTGAVFKPTAQCLGIVRFEDDGTETVLVGCSMGWQPSAYQLPTETAAKWARSHVQTYPEHQVVVQHVTRTVYYADAPPESESD